MRIAISRNNNWGTAGLLPVLIVGSIVWGCLGNESSRELLLTPAPSTPPLSSPILPFMLPSPPPPEDCTCSEGYTSTPAGSPCGCVVPIQVGLQLDVSLDSFLTLDIELAKELADGTFLHQSQVRIMKVNAIGANQEETDVFADLVPADLPFDNTTVQLIAQRFWTKEVGINETLFGNYSVLFVTYLGLPPSSSGGRNGSPRGDGNGLPRGQSSSPTERMKRGIMAIIIISSAVVFVIFLGVIWLLGIKCYPNESSAIVEAAYVPASKVSNAGSGLSTTYFSSTTPMSLSSSFAVYTGCARTFSLAELQKATRNFHAANVVGEGAFGRVYQGQLADGNRVAVKVLQQDDERGSREFLAEAELLSRLHHRNLVKLLGVCAEGSTRCLVYELIPNGSVDSHLHGPDGENGPMDWDARVKIALGAARGLAYLHEDSNPRVIHRDFKASNILLEDDFTPKISDFGLAKVASEGGSEHISTRVMGTFGYVAPEYAMTGHLLVKSDVYSYGVVLLELLSGKKPVDMSRPPGQENLVTWARPLLAHAEDLEQLLDPALEYEVPFENLAKMATIASMCVQPEVSNRPFMGEVVEALKLVYNDSKATEVRTAMNGTHTRESPSDGTQTPEPYYSEPFYRPSPTSTVEAKSSSMELSFSECESLRPFSGSAALPRRNRSLRRPGSF